MAQIGVTKAVKSLTSQRRQRRRVLGARFKKGALAFISCASMQYYVLAEQIERALKELSTHLD